MRMCPSVITADYYTRFRLCFFCCCFRSDEHWQLFMNVNLSNDSCHRLQLYIHIHILVQEILEHQRPRSRYILRGKFKTQHVSPVILHFARGWLSWIRRFWKVLFSNSHWVLNYQETITRNLQLPYIPVTAFSETDLFLVWIYLEFKYPQAIEKIVITSTD